MKFFKGVLIGLGLLLVIALAGGLLLPKDYRVERTVLVAAPAAFPFQQVNDVRNWEAWSPWKKMDPGMQITYGSKTVGEGASYSWKGEKAGAGSLRIVQSDIPRAVGTEIDFGPMGKSNGFWRFESAVDGTRVTWGFSGRNEGVFAGWFTLMMDRMVGPQFEEGLAAIKQISEAEAKRAGQLGRGAAEVMEHVGDAVRAVEEAVKAAGGSPTP